MRKILTFPRTNQPYMILTQAPDGTTEYSLFIVKDGKVITDECGFEVYSAMSSEAYQPEAADP